MSERLRSVVQQPNTCPDDRVVEIEYGYGVAATLICRRLEKSHLEALDRLAKTIRAATGRNAVYVEAGIAEFLVENLED